ncbi:MAG TPA: TolC family protein [Candidatus Kapabacteria bacterium]|nr:TolC family protein [Candidatus Kapabacteria bacterium]
MIVRKLVPSVAFLLMLKGTMDAQTPAAEQLTISQATSEAVEHNAALRALSFESAAAHGDVTTAGLRPNPSLTVNGDLLPSEGLTPKDKEYGASLAFPFELGGKRQARITAAQSQLDVTNLRYHDAVRQTLYAVKSGYIDLAGAFVKQSVSHESLKLLDSLVMLDRVRVQGQDIAAVDLARSEVERDKFSLDVLAAEQTYRAASAAMLGLLGRKNYTRDHLLQPDTATILRAASLVDQELPSPDSLSAIAAESRTDILVLRKSEEAATAQVELAKSLAAIDLTVSLDAIRQQEVTFWGASLTLPLPIFDRHQGDIQKAEALSSEAALQTEAALVQLHSDLTTALTDAETKRESLKRLVTNILSKSQSVRQSVEYAYRRGGTSLVDFLDAARTENELRALYVDALGAYAKSLITLDYLTGKDLFYALP